MHILWLTENYFPQKGGMAESCDRIVYGLRKIPSITLDLLYLNKKTTVPQVKQVVGGQHLEVPIADDVAHSIQMAFLWIVQQANGKKYDKIVAFGGYLPLLAAPVLAAKWNIPYIVALRGNDWDTALLDNKRLPVLDRAIRTAQTISVVTKSKANEIQYLYPRQKVIVTPNSIDTAEWKALPTDQEKALQLRQTTPDNRIHLGFLGYLKEKKGLHFFVENLVKMQLQDQFYLWIVGEISETTEHYLQRHQLPYTHAHSLDKWATIPYYLVADFVVIPSFYDGFPNTLLEAAALQKNLLLANVDGMADFIEKCPQCPSFAPADPLSLQKNLLALLRSTPAEKQAQAQEIYQTTRTHFSPKQEIKQWLKVVGEG
ncbi:MAG: glycosyltransferase [Cytophagales bacterium]|nr:MAG: glycosyltransferase [Cytophagales bacterium]